MQVLILNKFICIDIIIDWNIFKKLIFNFIITFFINNNCWLCILICILLTNLCRTLILIACCRLKLSYQLNLSQIHWSIILSRIIDSRYFINKWSHIILFVLFFIPGWRSIIYIILLNDRNFEIMIFNNWLFVKAFFFLNKIEIFHFKPSFFILIFSW